MNEPLTITEAMERYPKKTHRKTVLSHIRRGVKTPEGYIRLEATRVGGRWITTQEAIDQFCERVTAASGAIAPMSLSQKASIARSEAYLRSLGFH
jgi:hypothetical protein